jgi:hypothetical protein
VVLFLVKYAVCSRLTSVKVGTASGIVVRVPGC